MSGSVRVRGAQAMDFFKAWDKNGDGLIKKREYLVTLKLMLGDEARWRSVLRDVSARRAARTDDAAHDSGAQHA